VVSSLGLGATCYFSRQAQIESVQHELLQLAKTAAANMDVEAHRQLALTAKARRRTPSGGRRYRDLVPSAR
jgi:hypothetical protein